MERAEYLLIEERASIKARLVLWSNGSADDNFISDIADENDSDEDSEEDVT